MISIGVNGVVLRVIDNSIGDMISSTPIFGKTAEQWAGDAINAPYKIVGASPVLNIADRVKNAIDRSKQLTVILYGDTPLVTEQTINNAVRRLLTQNSNVVHLPRGDVYLTEYLFSLSALYINEPDSGGEFDSITDGESFSRISDKLRRRVLAYHANGGAFIRDFDNTYIDCTATVHAGAVIEPYNFIKGKSVVKSGAHILPGNYIENCIIDEGAKVDSSRLYDSYIGKGTSVGPFAYIRPDTVVGDNCRIGDFVELKKCIIGNGTKISHLTYVGDAELGDRCNVGCGVVFANYDGKNKYKSVIGSRVFIGSNSNIVAPVTVEDGAFIAAGSTLTQSVPSHALAIARARQVNIPNWAGNVYAPLDGKQATAPQPAQEAVQATAPQPIIQAQPAQEIIQAQPVRTESGEAGTDTDGEKPE